MRDFSRTTIAALAKKGIRVIGTQAAPAFDGDTAYSGRMYRIDDNGCGKIRSHSEIMGMA